MASLGVIQKMLGVACWPQVVADSLVVRGSPRRRTVFITIIARAAVTSSLESDCADL